MNVRASARWQLLAGTAVFFVLRLALTIPRTGPVVVADEVGYLTNARVLAGGVPGQLSTAPFYHGGYSLLLAPLLALDGNPKTSYHLVLVLNAVLAASLAPLVYLLLTRCFAVPARTAVWPSLAAAAYPSVTIYTQVAMSENLLLPLFTLWLLCIGCFLKAATDQRRLVWGAAAAICAVWLWAAHGRMIVVVALTVAVFLALVVDAARSRALGASRARDRRRRPRRRARPRRLPHLAELRRPRGERGEPAPLDTRERRRGRSVSAQPRRPGLVPGRCHPRRLRGAIASIGRDRLRRRRPTASEFVVALAVLTGLGLLVESALSFRTLDRPDMLVYGRYTDVVVRRSSRSRSSGSVQARAIAWSRSRR